MTDLPSSGPHRNEMMPPPSNWVRTTAFIGVAVILGLTIGLVSDHRTRLKLQEEHHSLQQQVKTLAQLMAENTQLSNRVAQTRLLQSETRGPSQELLRLRGQVGVLRQETKGIESVRHENRRFRAALENSLEMQKLGPASTNYWPRDSWSFAGYNSPDAALQSSIWACSKGDLKALLESATGEFRQMIEKDFEGKPDNEASIRAMDEVSRLKSVRVLDRDIQADDTVVLMAAFEDGPEIHTENLVVKKIGNDWKVSGPSNND